MIINYEKFLLENLAIDELREKLDSYGITRYKINDDMTIDCEWNVDLKEKNLDKIPFIFNKIYWNFNLTYNNISSLEGSPRKVRVSFYCSLNKLTDLVGSPDEVGDSFNCENNILTTLKGCTKKIGGGFNCKYNQLSDLNGGPEFVGGLYHYDYNDKLNIESYPMDCYVEEGFVGQLPYFNPILNLTKKFPEKYEALKHDKVKFHQQVMRDDPSLIDYYTTIKPPTKKSYI